MKRIWLALFFAFGCASPTSTEAIAPANDEAAPTCSEGSMVLSKKITRTKAFDYALDERVHTAGNADVDLTALFTIGLERTWQKSGCTTRAARIERVRLRGTTTLLANTKIDGTWAAAHHASSKLDEPILLDDVLDADGIPLPVTISLPIEAGFDASAPIEAGLDAHFEVRGRFDVTCDDEGCEGAKSATFDFNPNADSHVGFNMRATVTPWAKASVVVVIDAKPAARIDVRAALDSDFWGYYGNSCGDPEYVQAAVVDQSLVATIATSEVGRWHLGFWDLLPTRSTALAPGRTCNPFSASTIGRTSDRTRR